MLKHSVLVALIACSSYLVTDSSAQPGGVEPAPRCEEPIAGTVTGPTLCNCTSLPQSLGYDHWEKAAGPGGNGTMEDSSGGDIDYNGNPTTGQSGSGTLNVAAGKCVSVTYHFSCCPRAGGTFACGTTGQVTYQESDADCE